MQSKEKKKQLIEEVVLVRCPNCKNSFYISKSLDLKRLCPICNKEETFEEVKDGQS